MRSKDKFVEQDRLLQRMRSLANVLSKSNRILMEDANIHVLMQSAPHGDSSPGLSHYPKIVIHYDLFGDLSKSETLVELLGLNYHELSHLMFTPRRLTPGIIQDVNMKRAWNILEDQRIESLFTALYQPAGKYFTAMVIKVFINEKTDWSRNFLYTHGRTFLPLEIRQEFEARYNGSDSQRVAAKKIIEEFSDLTNDDYEQNPARVVYLVRSFLNILADTDTTTCQDEGNGGSGVPEPEQEKKAQEENQRRRQEEKETGEDQSGFWEEEDEENTELESDEEEEGRGTSRDDENSEDGGSSSGDSDDEDDDPGSVGDSGSPNEPESESDSGPSESSEGSSDGDSDTSDDSSRPTASDSGPDADNGVPESEFDDEELRDYLDEIIEAVEEDEAVDVEMDRIRRAMNDPYRIDVLDFDARPRQLFPVTGGMKRSLRNISTEFRRVYADVEPGWKYGSNVGKLNIGRAMDDPDNYDEIFDEWEEGREQESGIECVINLDTSVSMSGAKIDMASRALWIIKRALDDVEAKTTVIGFDARTVGLIDREVKEHVGKWKKFGSPGTNTMPGEAMALSRRVLSQTKMPNKLYVCITDGAWASGMRYPELLQAIPATRMYVGIDEGSRANSYVRDNYFDAQVSMTSEDSLVIAVKDAVTHLLQNVRREAKQSWL